MSTTIKYPKIAPDFSEAPKGAWSQNSIKDYLYPLSFICWDDLDDHMETRLYVVCPVARMHMGNQVFFRRKARYK